MEDFLDEGSSFYHRLLATYSRSVDGTLLKCEGPAEACISRELKRLSWQTLVAALEPGAFRASSATVPALRHPTWLKSPACGRSSQEFRVQIFESRQLFGSIITGLAIVPSTSQTDAQLDDRLARLVLKYHGSSENSTCMPVAVQDLSTAEAVTSLFESTLRHEAIHDAWDSVGRKVFLEKIEHFVSKGVTIELCLPAFPCKSSNLDKVGGTTPDHGEYIALSTLHEFVRRVEDVYLPGAILWIISDGHVFSDCSMFRLLSSLPRT